MTPDHIIQPDGTQAFWPHEQMTTFEAYWRAVHRRYPRVSLAGVLRIMVRIWGYQ